MDIINIISRGISFHSSIFCAAIIFHRRRRKRLTSFAAPRGRGRLGRLVGFDAAIPIPGRTAFFTAGFAFGIPIPGRTAFFTAGLDFNPIGRLAGRPIGRLVGRLIWFLLYFLPKNFVALRTPKEAATITPSEY